MSVVLRLASLLIAGALASCASVIDAGHARVCRSIIPALNPPGSVIEIVRTAPLAAHTGLRIDYRVRSQPQERRRYLECTFGAGTQASRERVSLLEVRTEEGKFGGVRLHLLKRFWLGVEGPTADPEPVRNVEGAPDLPRGLAIGLQHLIFALPPIAIYSLLAAAYSLVYGLVGRINFAFGELAAVGGYAAFLGFALVGAWTSQAMPLLVAVGLALLAAALHGLAAGRLLLTPLTRSPGQQALIATIALAIVLQEYLRLTQGSKQQWMQPVFNTPYALARSNDFVVTFTPIAVAAAVVCLLAAAGLLAFLKASRFGRAWRACADDASAAALFGINRRAVLLRTFAIASALAGLAGYVVTVYYGALGYAGGVVLGLKSLFAAIVGGIGSVPGAFLGGVLLGCVETLWSALFPIEFRDLAIFVLLVVLLITRPSGLFGLSEVSLTASSRKMTQARVEASE